MRDRRNVFVALVTLAALLAHAPARAADTLEQFDRGLTDMDLYIGFDGAGPGVDEKATYGEIMIGGGLLDNLSAFAGVVIQGDETLTRGAGEAYAGLMLTPIDTDHLDLDLLVELRVAGATPWSFQATPSFELNVDADAAMSSWGLYLRGGVPLYGRDNGRGGDEMALHVETTLGAYVVLGSRHQLLLEYDMNLTPSPLADQRAAEVGGLALGYNLTLTDSAELISQVFLDLPQADEPLAVNFMLGVIFTMPGVS